MSAKNLIIAAVAATTIIASGAPASAWSGGGHRTVAAIAMKLLPPAKAAALDSLLRTSKVDRSFVDAASYADEFIRDHDPDNQFSPWHFLNWPVGKPTFSTTFCDPDCVTNELPKQIDVMRTATDNEEKALALSWVIHLVGDLHQPLHIADRNDEGGNKTMVHYQGAGAPRCDAEDMKLHHAWDDCLVRELEKGRTPSQLADELVGKRTTYKGHAAASGTPLQWAKTSHDLARDVSYKNVKNNGTLTTAYIRKATPVVRTQLIRAGVRLAKILDENM